MNRSFSLMMIAALSVAACSKPTGNKAIGEDVLGGTATTIVAFTTQCTVPNPDGVQCDKKTCKADPRSDCKRFRDRCTQSDHDYEGDDSSGTCIRGDQVG